MYAGSTAGLAARLLVGLAAGNIVSVEGVADCAGPLRAILAVPMVWFKVFLAFNCLACALIWQRLWLIAKQWSVSSFSVYMVVKTSSIACCKFRVSLLKRSGSKSF